jgi:Cu(I)/Ag(I) efflux system periplasmic protein CusF
VKNKRFVELLMLFVVAALVSAMATGSRAADVSPAAKSATVAQAALSTGEVRQIDKTGGKVTIKHGPIANLDMPPMTMVFRVKDQSMLDKVKSGDRISFAAEKLEGALVVTRIETTP